ncbi:hypothetical protein AQI88_30400 [Streptomyces cellostaticus]|uniref:Right handed beta helix domain-containing protein n=1 Tax=Streptomyces cellostaticus TaxID=67285 RepID=A0A101NGB1_9ACTN|nr:hypothetical protein [Streptomyces cellostaticus]KUM92694.1 hypothetical protein AQI88_30400 [Streptomyces cellostaticus]GHI06703.1 hypothetical protein Scel_50240 [Streptomyces cellostaticus]
MRKRPAAWAVSAGALAMALGLAGGMPAAAAQTIQVNCANQNLQTAINNAPSGSTIVITGICVGQFTIANKDLTLVGSGGAVLDGGHAGRTLTKFGPGNQVQLTNLTIANGTDQFFGGGIINYEGTLSLTRTVVRNNSARHGGGIFNGGTLTVISSVVRDNDSGTATQGVGGGIFNNNPGTTSVINSLIQHNTVTGTGSAGGGLFESANSTVTLNRTTVRNNSAEFGGGLFSRSTMTVNNSTVVFNTATAGPDSGGGIYQGGDTGVVTLHHTTVRDNTPENCAPDNVIQGCTN